MPLTAIQEALSSQKFETARRLCLEALEKNPDPTSRAQVLGYLHDAYLRLGDIRACLKTLESIEPTTDAERLALKLRLAEDLTTAASHDHYRTSEQKAAGFTYEEYQAEMESKAHEQFEQARRMAVSGDDRRALAESLRKVGRGSEAVAIMAEMPDPPQAESYSRPTATGSLAGSVTMPDGTPAAGCMLTLGLSCPVQEPAPDALNSGMGYSADVPDIETLRTRTDARGAFRLENVPAGMHEFLAITLDPMVDDVAVRFLAHGIEVRPEVENRIDFTAHEWRSSQPYPIAEPQASVQRGGTSWRRVHTEVLRNPFHFDFPRQPLTFSLPQGVPADPSRLLLLETTQPDTPQEFQIDGCDLTFFVELPGTTTKTLALYFTDAPQPCPEPACLLPIAEHADATAVIDTGQAQFRIPWHAGEPTLPPLMAVRGVDGVWRGAGRLTLPPGVQVKACTTRVVQSGPLVLTVETDYELSTGKHYTVRFTAHRGEAYLLAHEISPPVDGAAFEFSLSEFSGGRGYLHWTPEHGNVHWTDLAAADRTLARLEESVPWWLPPEGFGYAMTADGTAQRDYIGVFTIRRGEWIDREFEKICNGPGDDRRELDWPFPEMIGSDISMITAHTTAGGDAFFRFRMFDGERHWGIIVSALENNDGPCKEISAVQHKNSSPRLQDFKDWRLDEADRVHRPSVVAGRSDLIELRRRKHSDDFAGLWQRLARPNSGGAGEALRAVVECDPAALWRLKKCAVIEALTRSRMTLLGRDYGDNYSPVGGRGITPWAEGYDLIAPTGVFTPDEERTTRAALMLMGHMYISTDLMNWRYNSRNANFEADRVDIVGAVGLAFRGNPDADYFVAHAVSLMKKSLEVYCTPGSGKWYENPACYYLHASKCRTNLVYHLASHGVSDTTDIERFRDFLRWGVLLLTPPLPHSYEEMRDGLSREQYSATGKVRRVPPIGDHAHIGPWVPDHYALMAQLYRKRDPEMADLLLWAWQEGGCDGGYAGNAALAFARLKKADLQPARPHVLTSRRLEGFGAIFRGNFARPDEFYMLLKLGPGGYRYHRTEGSIILIADGRPLIYDGGEGGETWRHTTLSFYDVHMPPAPGHIERFHSFPGLDFTQGVNPKALEPGDPVFLSDGCRHEYVQLAIERFAEPDPAISRSITWIKDQYLILHDELRLPEGVPSFWHLQAVADSETHSPGEGYIFRGRFGTDLQVLLPDQQFIDSKLETLPIHEYHQPPERTFAMRHLALQADSPDHYLAVLRPLKPGHAPVAARLLDSGGAAYGVCVTGEGIDDTIFLARGGTRLAGPDAAFDGRYGAVIRRPASLELALLDGHHIEAGGVRIASTGPAVYLKRSDGQIEAAAEGTGTVEISGAGSPLKLELDGGRTTFRF